MFQILQRWVSQQMQVFKLVRKDSPSRTFNSAASALKAATQHYGVSEIYRGGSLVAQVTYGEDICTIVTFDMKESVSLEFPRKIYLVWRDGNVQKSWNTDKLSFKDFSSAEEDES